MLERKIYEPKALEPKAGRQVLTTPHRRPETSQRRLMVGALVLLLAALAALLYHDRDFWFPETQEAEEQPDTNVPSPTASVQQPKVQSMSPAVAQKRRAQVQRSKRAATASATAPSVPAAPNPTDSPVNATARRTVLPPLEVEVVAGDNHRTVQPGTNSVHVELQPAAPLQRTLAETSKPSSDTAAGVTSNAAERVQMTADSSNIVTHSVRPGYPLLARQMKVQGSVILQALIGRDGAIQYLHVVSGPPILASAAQEAVKQWRFKPHYLGSDAVETEARITVNFTISTN